MNVPRPSWLRFLLVVALVGGTTLLLRARSDQENLPPHKALNELPMGLGGYMGKELQLPERVLEVLGDGQFLSRLYLRRSDPPVDLFVAFFPTQRTGSTMHSPQNCLPGAGWAPLESGRAQLERPGGGTITVNRYVIGKGLDRQLVLYWYQSHGRVVASEYWAKFYLVADAIRMNRSDGSLVRLVTPIPREQSADEAERRLREFAEHLIPLLDNYIPQ